MVNIWESPWLDNSFLSIAVDQSHSMLTIICLSQLVTSQTSTTPSASYYGVLTCETDGYPLQQSAARAWHRLELSQASWLLLTICKAIHKTSSDIVSISPHGLSLPPLQHVLINDICSQTIWPCAMPMHMTSICNMNADLGLAGCIMERSERRRWNYRQSFPCRCWGLSSR